MIDNTATVTTATGPDPSAITSTINAFLDGCRGLAEPEELIDLAAFMMYASYVSRNAEALSVDLDRTFDVDAVPEHMGNDYVARDFVGAYRELESPWCRLPLVELEIRGYIDLREVIFSWVRILSGSGLSLEETDGFDVARSIARALGETYSSRGGRFAGEYASYAPLSRLVIRLADVSGKSVFDPACGYGTFLAEAALEGASSLSGIDLDSRAIQRAKILAFFADPNGSVSLEVGNSFLGCAGSPFDRVVCAPPLGMRITRGDLAAYVQAAGPLEDGTVPNGSYGEDYFIAGALAALAKGGIAVIHVSPSFLFHQQRSRREFRQALVAQGHVSVVIELPGGCVPGTSAKSAVVILTKEPSQDDVLLIDAASGALEDKGYFDQSRRMCAPTDAGVEWLCDTVSNRREIPSVSVLVPRERIVATDADLCFATYGEVYTDEKQPRPVANILADIEESSCRINKLNTQIDQILTALRGTAANNAKK